MKRRTIYIILVVIIILLVIGLLIYLIISGGQQASKDQDSGLVNPIYYSKGYDELAYSDDQNNLKIPEKIIEDNVKTPTLSFNEESIQYFSDETKKFTEYIISSKKSDDLLGEEFKEPYQNILWSPNKNKAYIGSYNEGYSLIDLNRKYIEEMGGSIKALGWSPNGLKIAYEFKNVLKSQDDIAISDPNGSNWKKVIDLSLPRDSVYNSIEVGWYPGGESLYYSYLSYTKPEREYVGIDISKKTKTDLNFKAEKRSVNKILFSPDGNRILFSAYNKERPSYPEVWVMDLDGNNKIYTGIENKLEKCTWMNDSENIICALSANIQNINNNDILVKVMLSGMSQTQLTGFGDEIINVRDLFINSDDSYLYFVNNKNENLYRLKLN